jgi:VanZ family protein
VRRALAAWAPALLWAAAIFSLSSRPTLPPGPALPGIDKLAHLAAYALGGFLLARAAAATRLAPVWALALGWLFAASDEWHQAFVPGRAVELADWAADALGVALGAYLFQTWQARRTRGRDPLAEGAPPLQP